MVDIVARLVAGVPILFPLRAVCMVCEGLFGPDETVYLRGEIRCRGCLNGGAHNPTMSRAEWARTIGAWDALAAGRPTERLAGVLARE